MRLIDESELKNGINRYFCNVCSEPEIGKCKACEIAEILSMIDDTPTVEATPMKRGRWKRLSQFCLECSCCADISDCLTNYCSECGAKMEGIDET